MNDPESPPSSVATTFVSQHDSAVRLPRGTAIGRYLVLDLLGEGGMGSVYRAYDPELGRTIAVKLVKLSGDAAGADRTRLLREAQAMARLAHPNVVTVFDAGPFGAQLYVAMELVGGGDLGTWLRQRKRARKEILRKFIAAGEGLEAAHARGLVHRDFKPENVLVGEDERVRVTDFGLAHLEEVEAPSVAQQRAPDPGVNDTSRATMAGQVFGTPAYMAPEQFLGGTTDARTDQFAFCVALWEALAGERPFAGEDFVTIRRSVLNHELRAPPQGSLLSARLRRVLTRGLASRPQGRYPSMASLLALLKRDRSLLAPRLAAGIALACLVLGSVGAQQWYAWRERTRCPREAQLASAKLWDAPRRAAVASALAAAGLDAQSVSDDLSAVDQHLRALEEAQAAACEERRVGPEDRRAAQCLQRATLRAEAITRLLGERSPDLGIGARLLLVNIDDPRRCLSRAAPRPANPEVPLLRAQVEEMQVLYLMSRHGQVAARARLLVPRAKAMDARAESAALEELLGESLWYSDGPTDEALQAFEQALSDADASGDDEQSLDARADLVNFLILGRSDLARAECAASGLDPWFRRLESPPLLAHDVLTAQANLAAAQQRSDDTIALARQAIEAAERAGSPAFVIANSHTWLATEYTQIGRLSEAASEYEAALKLFEQARFDLPVDHALALGNLSITRLHQGRVDEALALAEHAARVHEPVKEQARQTSAWIDLLRAEALEFKGERAPSLELYDALIAHEALLDPPMKAEALAGRARLRLSAKRADEALKDAEEAMAVAQSAAEDKGLRGLCHWTLAMALWDAGGDRDRALEQGRRAAEELRAPEEGFFRAKIEAWQTGKSPLPHRSGKPR